MFHIELTIFGVSFWGTPKSWQAEYRPVQPKVEAAEAADTKPAEAAADAAETPAPAEPAMISEEVSAKLEEPRTVSINFASYCVFPGIWVATKVAVWTCIPTFDTLADWIVMAAMAGDVC